MSTFCFAQNVHEIKGKYNSYIQEDMPGYYYVYRKGSIFTLSSPDYLTNTPVPKVEIKNEILLNVFVRKYLMPYFINYKGVFINNTNTKLSLYSDIYGNITDISIMYPKEIGIIPISVIEEFNQSILNSCISLQFESKDNRFKEAEWITQSIEYLSKDLQNNKL